MNEADFDPRCTVPARYWHQCPDDRIQCDLCPRFCRLRPGQRGLCFVRGRRDDELVLTSWGRSSGFCIDPVEKKPLYHFLPGSSALSFGTAGCNLACKFCQNWDISKARDTQRLSAAASPETIADWAMEAGAQSVAYTYNDPIVFLEYAVDTAMACRARGVRNVAVSAGYVCPGPREELFAAMDAVNVDLKAFTERFYRKLCGGHLEPVKETLCWLVHETPVWTEITTLLIPGQNDSDEELAALSAWIASELGPDVPLHLTAFHPAWKMRDTPATRPETLRRGRRIALEQGLRYVYIGNVQDEAGATTWCSVCGAALIRRRRYAVTDWHLDGAGCCGTCATPLPGVLRREFANLAKRRAG